MSEIERQKQSYAKGFNQALARWRVASLRKYCVGTSCLDVGCGEGDVTLAIADRFERVVALDMTAEYLATLASRNSGGRVQTVLGSLEEFTSAERFDTIVAVDVLEHVADPAAVLVKLRGLLAPGGRVLIVVPNAESLHRRVGQAMGLIQRLDELGPQDHAVGHRRYYTPRTVAAELAGSGLRVAMQEGILLKPFPNSEMDRLSVEYLDGLYQVGLGLPELCAEILSIGEP